MKFYTMRHRYLPQKVYEGWNRVIHLNDAFLLQPVNINDGTCSKCPRGYFHTHSSANYIKVYDGQCGGGTTYKGAGLTVEECYQKCDAYVGFLHRTSNNKCWCSSESTSTCTLTSNLVYDRYDNRIFSEKKCRSCQNGRYNDQVGLVGACTKLCPVGTSYDQVTTLADSSLHTTYLCPDCAARKYADAEGLTVCKDCGTGRYFASTGATSNAACTACGIGKFSTATGATSSSTCENCPAGKYGDQTGVSACKSCGQGRYYSGTGATSSTTCTACGMGKFSTATGAVSSATCENCPAGQYGDQTAQSGCKDCGTGRYSAATGAVSSATCENCPTGKYGDETGLSVCTICERGYYNNIAGSSSCTTCAAGKSGGYVEVSTSGYSNGVVSETQCSQITSHGKSFFC